MLWGMTYSIVARDLETGELGVAVQSHWFAVGTLVPWAEAGVGAIATQSFVEPAYGPRGLELLRAGVGATAALARLLAADPGRETRQVGIVDAGGGAAAHTGARCIACAGQHVGEGYTVQANMMAGSTVWPAMAEAYQSERGPLADRLLAALMAADGEGGDLRGRQSAALLVVRAQPSSQPWTDRLVDLRVDDHEAPLEELARLRQLQRAYEHMNSGDAAMERAAIDEARRQYAAAALLAPERAELVFWHAVTLAAAGRGADAAPLFGRVLAGEEGARWRELLRRLPAAGLITSDVAAQFEYWT
jgi:uncharacterized Ntn-hydrolase superfamily protein